MHGDGREWEDDTLLPEQELLVTTPSGAEASGKTGFQLTALESPGGSQWHLAASAGQAPSQDPGPRETPAALHPRPKPLPYSWSTDQPLPLAPCGALDERPPC